ncbi:MAG: COG1361 S-layer family protein [Halolamina sp.]
MRTSLTLLLVVVLVTAPMSIGPAAAADPSFETTVPEPVVTPGSTQELTFQLTNDAGADESAETAENVKAAVGGGDTPIDVDSGPRSLGPMRDGDTRTVSVRITVPETIDAGSYRLPVTVTYEHDGETKEQTVHVTVRVEDRAYFRVESVDASVAVGDTGTVAIEMTNVGTETASAASVTVSSRSSEITLGRAASASHFAGEWAPGETKTLTYDVRASEGASTFSYTLSAQVSYDDASGRTRQSQAFRFGVTPVAEQTFNIGDVDATLRVGEDGVLSGTITNTGPRTAESVVLAFTPSSPTVSAQETEFAVGDLAPGESANFSFDVAVSESAAAGPRQFDIDVRYRNEAGERRTGDGESVRATIAPTRPRFAVSPLAASFEAGESGELRVELTNNGDEPLSDVSAKLYASAPLSASNDEAFVPRLEPGETAELVFGIGAGGDAIPKDYPVKLDFRYEMPDGDSEISDTYQVPVTVESTSGNGLPVFPITIGVLVLLAIAGGALYLRE